MKFAFFLLVLCACVLPLGAQAQQEVYSLNIVGFQKSTVVSNTGGTLFLGNNPFDSTPNYIDAVIGTNGLAGNTLGDADNVIMYAAGNPGSYTTYWLYSNSTPSLHRRWRSVTGWATNVYLYPSRGFWFKNRAPTNATLVFVGDVVDMGAITNVIIPGLQLMGYPFSSQWRISDLDLTNGVAGNTLGEADNIIVYDSTLGYTTYWLYSNSTPSLHRRWRSVTGWATNWFPPSKGFWYKSRNAGNLTWTQARPYSL